MDCMFFCALYNGTIVYRNIAELRATALTVEQYQLLTGAMMLISVKLNMHNAEHFGVALGDEVYMLRPHKRS